MGRHQRKRKDERQKRKDERQKRAKEREQSEKQAEKQAEEWVNRRRRLIIAKGPEINKITRSVFGNIRYFDINVLNGELCFSTKIGDFSIHNALSKDYESLLGELEEKKKRREYMLANMDDGNGQLEKLMKSRKSKLRVAIRTNIDSRSSKSYSRKSISNNDDDYDDDDDDG